MRNRMYLISALVLSALAGSAAASAAGPSFRCAGVTRADERAICRSAKLSALDRRMTALYREMQSCSAMGSRGANTDDQREWIAGRARCGGDTVCLTRIYRARIAEFAPRAARARAYWKQEMCPGPV